MYDVAVDPVFSGLGVGTALLKGLVAACVVDSACDQVSLDVRWHNPARGLYRRLGFAEQEREWGSYDWHGGMSMAAPAKELIALYSKQGGGQPSIIEWAPADAPAFARFPFCAPSRSQARLEQAAPAVPTAPPVAGTASETQVPAVRTVRSDDADSVLLWTHEQADANETLQIGASACGATAVINAFAALGRPVAVERAVQHVVTRQRKYHVPLAEYLRARSVAGVSHEDFLDAVPKLCPDAVARFCPTHPRPSFDVIEWMRGWLALGAAPIATFNCQAVSSGGSVPDAWHHQMVYGVSGTTVVHATNGMRHIGKAVFDAMTSTASILLIRRDDVLRWYSPHDDLAPLDAEPRWRAMRVRQQVLAVVAQASMDTPQHEGRDSDSARADTPLLVLPSLDADCDLKPSAAAGGGGGAAAEAPGKTAAGGVSGSGGRSAPGAAAGIGSPLPYITHIAIPASYTVGVTLVAVRGTPAYQRLTSDSAPPFSVTMPMPS